MSSILPFLIPIVALFIPIVAIVAGAATRKYRSPPEAQREFRDYVHRLERRVVELEESVRSLTSDLGKIEADQRFLSRLLEDRTKAPP